MEAYSGDSFRPAEGAGVSSGMPFAYRWWLIHRDCEQLRSVNSPAVQAPINPECKPSSDKRKMGSSLNSRVFGNDDTTQQFAFIRRRSIHPRERIF